MPIGQKIWICMLVAGCLFALALTAFLGFAVLGPDLSDDDDPIKFSADCDLVEVSRSNSTVRIRDGCPSPSSQSMTCTGTYPVLAA